MQTVVTTKDIIAQHNLVDDEYEKTVGILVRELICIEMDS
jgi:hypothetical protein